MPIRRGAGLKKPWVKVRLLITLWPYQRRLIKPLPSPSVRTGSSDFGIGWVAAIRFGHPSAYRSPLLLVKIFLRSFSKVLKRWISIFVPHLLTPICPFFLALSASGIAILQGIQAALLFPMINASRDYPLTSNSSIWNQMANALIVMAYHSRSTQALSFGGSPEPTHSTRFSNSCIREQILFRLNS